MVWLVKCLGDGKVLINGTAIHDLDSFIECLKDEDKRIKSCLSFPYNGE